MDMAWDGEARAISKHSTNLLQLAEGRKVPPSGWKCEQCDLTENLWLNLTDGAILCGRKNFDGSGGNNHAVEHYQMTNYPLAVKLGTITPDGADVYSYVEDDMVIDPQLGQHLAHFGIDIMSMTKSDKTMAELELEMNQRVWEWSALQESSSQLQPLYGPGLTGIHNLGNSCYMNAVMQVIFCLPQFANKYFDAAERIFTSCVADPTTDFTVQMAKFARGLLSGDYSIQPDTSSDASSTCLVNGIRPLMFKALIGQGHREFATKKQQDAHEFLLYLLTLVERNCRGSSSPTESLKFRVEDRIECTRSHKVKYTYRDEYTLALGIPLESAVNQDELAAYEAARAQAEADGKSSSNLETVRPKIPLSACLDLFTSSSLVEDFYSSAVNARTTARKSTRLATFPDYLFLHMQKFTVGSDWVERKLDVSLDMPEVIDLSHLRGTGKQLHEQELPETGPAVPELNINEEIVSQLVEMGFPHNACVKGVHFTKNAGVEMAMNWVMEHMDDPDFDAPLQLRTGPVGGDEFMPDNDSLAMIEGMGFTRHQATLALKATDNNLERAVDWIFNHPDELNAPVVALSAAASSPVTAAVSTTTGAETQQYADGSGRYQLLAFISHMGTSTKAGHYVCHIRKQGQWVIFNDDKVALSEHPPKDLGYIYLYERL
jgi:ubiquitin carboxyl-terminal hydrolase 5/13